MRFANILFFIIFIVHCSTDSRHTTRHEEVSRTTVFCRLYLYVCMCAELHLQVQICVVFKHGSFAQKASWSQESDYAICKMLLTAIYAILKSSAPYTPNLYRSHNALPQKCTFLLSATIAFLKSRGFVIADLDSVLT